MKRLITLGVFLLCSLLTFAQFTGTVTDEQGVKYTANNDEGTCYVSGRDDNYSVTIDIPEMFEGRTVTSIGDLAFFNCSGLTSVTIPNSVTSIGNHAFGYCSGLTSVTIPNSVTSIGSGAFSGTAWFNNQSDGVVYAGKVAYEYKGEMPVNTSIVLDKGTLGIGGGAFSFCWGLASITIPSSVTHIANYAFAFCRGLTSIVVEAGNTVYDSREGCNAIIKTCDNELIAGCMNTTIPNSVTSIGMNAFEGCSGLTSITIPNSVTSIEDAAFFYCNGLTSVIIPNSVTSIGMEAFSGCSGLTSVTIGNSVTSIETSAFYGCSSLTSIVVEAGNTVYDSREGCNAIIRTSDNTLIVGCKNTTIPNSVTSIGHDAFRGCSGLTSVTIPNSVTSIGGSAFSGCSGLTSITIPNSVTNIGYAAFSGCSGLSSIVVEAGNTVYDSREGCNAIIKTIDNKLIAGCRNTIISNSVTSIGDHAFSGCSGLTSITIPNSVTSIGISAFRNCSGLTCVKVQLENPLEIRSDVFPNRANATLYVPYGRKDFYEAAAYWQEFKEIKEVEGMIDVSILDDALYAEDVTVYPDGATCFPILMKNKESITNIQFDVVLPEGVTIKNSTLTNRKGSDHAIATSSLDGATRFMVTSMGGKVFSDNEGAVINLSLAIDKNLAAGHQEITLRNITLSTSGAVKVNTPTCMAVLTVSDIESGDADGDGVTDVNDVTSTINHILKKPVVSFVRGAADVDGDNVIDVNDVQATIDKALGKTSSSRKNERQDEEPALDPQ